MKSAGDERQIGTASGWGLALAGGLSAATLLWLALFTAYRVDRADAPVIATLSVMLVIPPLMSYYLVMEILQDRISLPWRVFAAYGLALVWLVVQRAAVYPLVGYDVSIGESIANFILLPSFGIAFWLAVRSFLYRNRLKAARQLQAQTELRLLEAQLAPHTLFNMLNTVYAVLLTDPEKAIPLFVSMSEALRHVVDRTRKPWIPLHEELDFIEHYTALERARDPARVAITIKTEGDLDVPVPPMLLATLFENAVKHGRFTDGTVVIDVAVSVAETQMRLEVANRHPTTKGSGRGLGVGQNNVRNRLQLLYPNRSAFHVRDEGGLYRAVIEIAS